MSGHPARVVVALTGGIAAGKSAVSKRFEALGVNVYDADVAAREVVAPGSEGLRAIAAHFGPGVLDAQGQLDRAAMRRRVFGNDEERLALEAIVHPRVRQWMRARAEADNGPYCLLAIPLPMNKNLGQTCVAARAHAPNEAAHHAAEAEDGHGGDAPLAQLLVQHIDEAVDGGDQLLVALAAHEGGDGGEGRHDLVQGGRGGTRVWAAKAELALLANLPRLHQVVCTM